MTPATHAWPRHDADGRTHQKVRRGSRERLTVEDRQFITARQRGDRLRAFKIHATKTRVKGKRRGHEGGYGLHCADVLDFLMFFQTETGQVFPSYRRISEAVGCAYRTAVRCIRQLATGGWLSWERRLIRVADGGREPQVHQDTNFYRLKVPGAAGELVAAWTARRRAAVPDDVPAWLEEGDLRNALWDAHQAAERRNHHLISKLAAARTPDAVAHVLLGRGALSDALDRLGQSVHRADSVAAEREFPKGSQSRG